VVAYMVPASGQADKRTGDDLAKLVESLGLQNAIHTAGNMRIVVLGGGLVGFLACGTRAGEAGVFYRRTEP